MVETRYAQPNELRSQPARSLLLRLFDDLTGLMNLEYQLVKTEITQQHGVVARAAQAFGWSLAFALVAVACLAGAAIAELAAPLGLPLAAVAVGLVTAIVAFVLRLMVMRTGREVASSLGHASGRFLPASPASAKTLEEQQADIAWTRRRIEETLTALEHKSDLLQPLRDTAVGVGALGVAVANIVREEKRTRPN